MEKTPSDLATKVAGVQDDMTVMIGGDVAPSADVRPPNWIV